MNDNKLYLSILLKQIGSGLKPHGFSRKAGTFTRKSGDQFHFINVQSSMSTTAHLLKFTINLSIYSEAINQLFEPGDDIGCRGWLDNHWQRRIGSLNGGTQDLWWTVTTEDDAHRYGAEVANLIASDGLSEFDRYCSTRTLLAYTAAASSGFQAERARTALERFP